MLEGMDGEPGIDAFVSGGYLLAQPYVRPDGVPEDFVPADVVGSPVVTASPCLAEVLPGEPWFSTWLPSPSRGEQEDVARSWGVPLEALDGLLEWTASRAAEGRMLHDDAFADVETPRTLAHRFLRPRSPFRLLGLGLLRDSVSDVLRSTAEHDAVAFGPGWGAPNGVLDGVERRTSLQSDGHPLGYDVLSVALGEARHSWHCHHVERRFRDECGIRLERGGLLRTWRPARRWDTRITALRYAGFTSVVPARIRAAG